MRLPKTVTICGKTYNVEQRREMYDSGGSTLTQTIQIGCKSKKDERRFENFLHEVMEITACERGYRYGKGTSDDCVLVMNHKEFDNFSVDVATALTPLLKD